MAGLALVLVAASGCVTRGTNLTATGKVSVKVEPAEKVRVAWSEVWQDGDETIIKGRLIRRGSSLYPLTGHVDVSVMAPDGTVIKEATSQQIGVRRTTPGKGPKLTPFKLAMNFTPPQDSQVVIAFHRGTH